MQPRNIDPPARDSFIRRHRFVSGLVAGLLLAALALIILGLTTGPTKPIQTSTVTLGSPQHYAAAANVLCAATLTEVQRLDNDEHLARADAIAGKITRAALAARNRADLLALATLVHARRTRSPRCPPQGPTRSFCDSLSACADGLT
jgi:hypothetical protein